MAPDGYRNVEGRTELSQKHDLGRFNHWIEVDPERAAIWREAWDLLLTDKMTLEEIAEALHAKGYRYRTGRPFIEVTRRGKRKANISAMSNIFHNWTYAGWVVSEHNQIPPKTVCGNWEPLVSTEEFEQGLDILARRNAHLSVRRRQDYLLKGMVFYQENATSEPVRLTCSTSNTRRSGGGTPYYRISGKGGVSFLCSKIDPQIGRELKRIQVDPELLPLLQATYTQTLTERLGYNTPDEQVRLQNALKTVDEEEARIARLLASGKISEEVWDGLWAEWQDRRSKLRGALEAFTQERAYHIENLDAALASIAQIGVLYHQLERSDQKELLRQVVERVVIDAKGKVKLELRTPFAYLCDLNDELRRRSSDGEGCEEQVGAEKCADVREKCSTWLQPPQIARKKRP